MSANKLHISTNPLPLSLKIMNSPTKNIKLIDPDSWGKETSLSNFNSGL